MTNATPMQTLEDALAALGGNVASGVAVASGLAAAAAGNPTDLTATYGPVRIIGGTVARAQKGIKHLIGTIPPDATLLAQNFWYSVASDAGTTATITASVQDSGGVNVAEKLINAASVVALTTGHGTVSGVEGTVKDDAGPGWVYFDTPKAFDVISAVGVGKAANVFLEYDETGTASTTGGPFQYLLMYAEAAVTTTDSAAATTPAAFQAQLVLAHQQFLEQMFDGADVTIAGLLATIQTPS